MILFPDIELETRLYLLDALGPRWPGLEVRTEVPEGTDWYVDQPTWVVVTGTGTGARVGRVYERVMLAFECFAPTKGRASRLAAEVRAYIEAWSSVSGDVAGFSDNARPAEVREADIPYPSYWYSANLLFKATTLT